VSADSVSIVAEAGFTNRLREPRAALKPPAFSIQAAERWALRRSAKAPRSLFRLTDFWYVNFVRQPVPGERKTRYIMKIAVSQNYGASVAPMPLSRDPDSDLVGKDAREILRKKLCRNAVDRTAILDLVMGSISRPPDREERLDGTMGSKYVARSRIFADEAEHIIRGKCPNMGKALKARVLVIGATAGIIGALVERGFDVAATDLWPEAVGQREGSER
jgi:hypothetical protein